MQFGMGWHRAVHFIYLRGCRRSQVGLWLLGVFLFAAVAGCERKEASTVSTEASAPALTNPSNGSSGVVTSVLRTNFSVPFQGVIKAREQRDLMLNKAEVTYTIGKGKIRREIARTDPLGKLADMGRGSAGVICDRDAGTVVLYRTGQQGKAFVRMTLPEYRRLVAGPTNALMADIEAALSVKPAYWRHVGTFFVDVPRPIPEGSMLKSPEARTVSGLSCDVLMIQVQDTVFEVCHSQQVKVDRELLELVELRLPAEVTGFPCLMRRLQLVKTPVSTVNQATNPMVSKGKQLVQRGVTWAARLAEKALKREAELFEITEGSPEEAAFTLDKSFVDVRSLDELVRQFQPSSAGGDWDD